jgi:hypothetical protein
MWTAFIVEHAAEGGEETGDPGDIWSHKWVLPQEYDADGTKIYAYLTIPENAKLGMAAHELHLLLGFPDLYDTDYTCEGIGVERRSLGTRASARRRGWASAGHGRSSLWRAVPSASTVAARTPGRATCSAGGRGVRAGAERDMSESPPHEPITGPLRTLWPGGPEGWPGLPCGAGSPGPRGRPW